MTELLQLEWYMNGFDIEIDIFGPNKINVERIDLVSKQEIEVELTDEFSRLSDWVIKLTRDRSEEYFHN